MLAESHAPTVQFKVSTYKIISACIYFALDHMDSFDLWNWILLPFLLLFFYNRILITSI